MGNRPSLARRLDPAIINKKDYEGRYAIHDAASAGDVVIHYFISFCR
jgi:hypothetical protein